ncbi:hypothetical protein [Bacillus pinisoli]|uniref:hypothetical protein n=1 Tax=Bacillus pinisoli TaxID=2901866 RepID=UPI001FF18E51|nr:hypothetical protein [Bacillus pinisoli]
MGYILPITQHEYTQYANRMVKTGVSPYVLTPIAKVSMEKKLKDRHNREQSDYKFEASEELTSVNSYRNQAQKPTKTKVSPRLISKITGKGNHINEAI